MKENLGFLQTEIAAARSTLIDHPMYTRINDLTGLKIFAESHVFAVWDFMSLLKSLQIQLTSVKIPWIPIGNPDTRFLINEIVLGEESDVDQHGKRCSHFELYLLAMKEMGADTVAINELLSHATNSEDIREAVKNSNLPINVKLFLTYTFTIAMEAPLHVKAAVFTFGREDLIPGMFMRILEQVHTLYPDKLSTFKYYIERHIEVDGDHHSNLATEMLCQLCGEDKKKWQEATQAAKAALEVRAKLWDNILEQLETV